MIASMKFPTLILVVVACVLLSAIFIRCTGKSPEQPSNSELVQPEKSDERAPYVLADEFLKKLRNSNTDTILFYKRTCIDCCDFYHVLWSEAGVRHAASFSGDYNERKDNTQRLTINADGIFEILGARYDDLKTKSIKENTHQNEDGTYTTTVTDHDCYTRIQIYTEQDSILSSQMKDHDFDRFTDFESDSTNRGGRRLLNDNYYSNYRSAWYRLLTIIEAEISVTQGLGAQEVENLMTNRMVD
jgi:hypothetical protein